METAVSYIEKDDPFYLRQVSGLDLYLKNGITTFTSKMFGPSFPDMTLIQFSIAMRKPKTLKYMLETTFNKCQVPFDQIITPTTSNTKGNLFTLAIYFGSKCNKYAETDVECLKVLIDFFNANKPEGSSIDIENINGETPLIKAIDLMNSDAIQLLLENGADIHHKSQNNSHFETPLRHLFRKADNIANLYAVFDGPLLGQKENIINNYFKERNFLKFLVDHDLQIGIQYVKDVTNNDQQVLSLLDEMQNGNTNPPNGDINPQPNPYEVEENIEECFRCHTHEGQMRLCNLCNHYYCEDCFDDHGCDN